MRRPFADFRIVVAAVSLLSLAYATPTPAYLSTLTVDKCLAGKLKIVGKGTAAYTKCHSKNTANPDVAAFNACTVKVSAKITDGFGKLDANIQHAPAAPAMVVREPGMWRRTPTA